MPRLVAFTVVGQLCADDVAVLGSRVHAQCIVHSTRGYCTRHRYCIHPKKSEEVPLNKDDKNSQCDIVFGEELISKVQGATHHGIHREASGESNINEKVQLGRRTLCILCFLLLPLCESVIVLCFVVRYFLSILVLQSSCWGRESWLLCLVCLPRVS